MSTTYVGGELEVFQHAVNWKRYVASFFKPYVQGSVAEIGAGLGANVPYLFNEAVHRYLCIEPDEGLAASIENKIASGILSGNCFIQKGILLPDTANAFDALLYIDVLEHIEDDATEVIKAATALRVGGYLCVLVPANPAHYSAFDKASGHLRRYTKTSLINVVMPSLQIKQCHYLDCFGALASKANRYFLRQSLPSQNQVLFWDRILVPASRIVDKLTDYRFGKSLLLVAQKEQ